MDHPPIPAALPPAHGRDAADAAKCGKKRGSYNCGRCGLPKKGHNCTNIGLESVGVKLAKDGAIEAVQQYGDIDIFTANFRPLKATLSGLPDRVFMKLVVCAKTNEVLGLHMCGEDAPEIVQIFVLLFFDDKL
ncbi:hypothetical protein JHK86_004110 [Glycine max]|nr:hypothetical protein JHK86_004101 [Glycine max]KAG5080039.1 hypothetical protein JHK86_004104 [Glycine max]KAG5080042.1 hypothetical protein JHK86_004107 [Glycine max]KAG5080045.1 hypothetical protein JHK86_004110 [Glycine max]